VTSNGIIILTAFVSPVFTVNFMQIFNEFYVQAFKTGFICHHLVVIHLSSIKKGAMNTCLCHLLCPVPADLLGITLTIRTV